MTPHQILERLGRRFDVHPGYGKRFLPLIRRALEAGPEVRERILALVETSFEREQERLQRRREARTNSPDWRLIRAVARILHGWNPPDWLLRWGEGPQPSQ